MLWLIHISGLMIIRLGGEAIFSTRSPFNIKRSTKIYDLTGRKVLNVENLKGGIYIVNGRKVVVK